MKDRKIWITIILSFLIHLLIFYEWTVRLPDGAPEKRDVMVSFNIKKKAKQKAVRTAKKIPDEKPRVNEKPETADPPPVPAPVKKPRAKKEVGPAAVEPEPETEPEPTEKESAEEKEIISTESLETVADNAVPEPGPIRNEADRKDEFSSRVIKKIEDARIYPMTAKRMGIEGEVFVGFTIFPDGSVDNIKVMSSSHSHKLLERAAVSTVKKAAPYVPVPPDIVTEKGLRFSIKIAYRLT